MPHIRALLSSRLGPGHAGKAQRAAAEQSAALPAVADQVRAAASPVGTRFDVTGVDPHWDAEIALAVLVAVFQRRFEVARVEHSIAADLDRRGVLDRQSERF